MNDKLCPATKPVQAIIALLAVVFTAAAQVPETLSYQGRISVGGTNFTGTGQFKFALVDQGQAVVTRTATATATITSGPLQPGRITSVTVTDGGSGYFTVPNVRAIDPLRLGSGASLTAIVGHMQVVGVTINSGGANYSAQTYIDIQAPPAQTLYETFWSNDGTSSGGSAPAAFVALPIDQGLFAVLLGNTALSNMNTLPASVFTNADARLRIWFNDGVQGFMKLSPDQPLGAVGYAMMAGGLPLGAVTAQNIAVGTIDGSRLANGTITSNQLAAGSVHVSHLAGPLPESVLGTNVALRLGGNAFSGDQTLMSGELGIGTLAPDGTLDVRTKIISQGSSGNNHTNLVFKKTLSLGSANAEMVFSHRSSGTELWLYGNNGINGLRNLQGWHYASNAVTFPAGGQTLYIDEGQGRVGVGRKPVADVLEVGGDMSVYGVLTVSGGYAFTGDLLAPRLNVGTNQVLSGLYATIAGGRENTNSGSYATLGGGYRNTADAAYATVAGGERNVASAGRATVGGGSGNSADSYAVVAGGRNNAASGAYSTVAGGVDNAASGNYTSIGGGSANTASYLYATVPGGRNNQASGESSFAAGRNANANHDFSFIWNSGSAATATTKAQSFVVHASGGAFFNTGTNALWSSGDMSCDTLTIRGGADLAEPFAVSGDDILAGSVVVIDEQNPGRLKLSTAACDTKVAGIVSGAGGVQPGISMIQKDALEGGRNVALSGRVYAWVDATKAPVAPGDLLTTSDTPGHAMKVMKPGQASGAILGKAMTPLREGRGLVLVLVSLQ